MDREEAFGVIAAYLDWLADEGKAASHKNIDDFLDTLDSEGDDAGEDE